jgi:hypothetical protein
VTRETWSAGMKAKQAGTFDQWLLGLPADQRQEMRAALEGVPTQRMEARGNAQGSGRGTGGTGKEPPAPVTALGTTRKREVPPAVAQMMRSQKIAPDILDKGVHFNVGKIELRVVPDHEGGIVFRPVHPGMIQNNPRLAKEYKQALKAANEALQHPEFIQWLKKHAEKGLELAATSKDHAGKGAEFNFLLRALERYNHD